jgi:hypothetical protein
MFYLSASTLSSSTDKFKYYLLPAESQQTTKNTPAPYFRLCCVIELTLPAHLVKSETLGRFMFGQGESTKHEGAGAEVMAMEKALLSTVQHSPWCLPDNDLPFSSYFFVSPFYLFFFVCWTQDKSIFKQKKKKLKKPTREGSIAAHMLHRATNSLQLCSLSYRWLGVVLQAHFS